MPTRSRRRATRLAQLGQSMVEYAIIAAIVAVIALVAVRGLGNSVQGLFGHVQNCVTQADTGGQTC